MEYVEGMLLVDLTSSTEFISQPLWIKSLAGWLHRLHSVNPLDGKVLCFPDCNLRNLIYADGEITGVDFEETVYDWPERDIGGICAFILNSDPMFTGAKYRAVQQLAASYASLQSINMKRLQEYCLYELEQAAQRRPGQHDILLAKINELQDGKIFG
jgi:aminoglycoside phosphotransferase (APT) family kinase protein